jgi:HEAT repeat protein
MNDFDNELFDDDELDEILDYEEDEPEEPVFEESRPQPSLGETINALLEGERFGTPGALIFYGLSGLTQTDMIQVKPVWDQLDIEYRRKVAARMEAVGETNYDLDYQTFALFATNDDDAEVRKSAVEVLAQDETLEAMNRLADLAQWDEADEVRAAALSGLGHFILLGEYGELPEREVNRVQDLVIALYNDQNEETEIRRRALEAISNSSHEMVEEAIREAYQSPDRLMRVSAVYAMGRSCDEQWARSVMREFSSLDPEMRFEAARAAGELELEEAVPHLSRLAHEGDAEIREAAIWALGEIGGRQALNVLTRLADEAESIEDDALLDLIQDAIGSASLPGERLGFDD